MRLNNYSYNDPRGTVLIPTQKVKPIVLMAIMVLKFVLITGDTIRSVRTLRIL